MQLTLRRSRHEKDISISVLLCVLLVLPAYLGVPGLTVSQPQLVGNGVAWYDSTSSYNGPGSTTLRVLPPTNPASGMSHRFIYVLPVIPGVDLQDEFGDGLEELRALNVHNHYNAHIIAPSFKSEPWYADHDSNPDLRYERFMVRDLVPWVQANLSVTGQEEHWLIGFSKSGFGALTLLLRNPTVFDAAAAWDFPADQSDAYSYRMLDNYGTDTNLQNNYRLTADWIAARKEPFQTATRIWLSKDYVTYNGIPTFRDEVLAFAGRLSANDVQFVLAGGATRTHSWTSGWLLQAVAGLQDRLDPGQRRDMESRRRSRGARDRRASTGEAGDASRRTVIVGAVSHRAVVRRCGRIAAPIACRVFGDRTAEMHHEHSDTPATTTA